MHTQTRSILSLQVAPQSLRNDPPTLDELEAQGHLLKARQDKLWLEIGNWAVTVARYYGSGAYERLLAICGFDNQAGMVEDWAYVCRNVPQEVQVPGVLFSFHRAVAPIKDHALQAELLQFAEAMCSRYKDAGNNYTVAMFRMHINAITGKQVNEPPQPPPGNRSDRQWELEQELHKREVEYQEERTRRQEAEATVAQYKNTGISIKSIVDRIQSLVASLSVAQFLSNPSGELERVAGELEAIRGELEGFG